MHAHSQLRLRASLLLNLCCVPLRPVSHSLALNLATRQLRHLLNKYDAADKALMLCNPRNQPVCNVLRCDLAFGCFLDHNVGARPLVAVAAVSR